VSRYGVSRATDVSEVGSGNAPASRAVAAADSGAARADEGFWVAVLPFKYSGGNADLTALAEGLTADIVTGLSRFILPACHRTRLDAAVREPGKRFADGGQGTQPESSWQGLVSRVLERIPQKSLPGRKSCFHSSHKAAFPKVGKEARH
jgi:hypothetical protein